MSSAPRSNPFEFTNDLPQQRAARPPRPIRRRPRFLWAYPIGFVVLSFAAAVVGRVVWLAQQDRTYRGPVVGRWAYDGPSRVRELNATECVATIMTFGFYAWASRPHFYERPGWSLEMRTDGVVYDHGKRLGDWSARGKENGWVLVHVSEDWSEPGVWKFRPGPDGKLEWMRREGDKPIPLRSIP